MPRSPRPGEKYPIYLESYADLPREQQPVFFAKTLSVTQFEELLDECAAADELPRREQLRQYRRLIDKHICEAKNLNRGEGELVSLLSVEEVIELIAKIVGGAGINEDDRKNFESPPSSSTVNSAATAGQASA
jgi:hypothetical protein